MTLEGSLVGRFAGAVAAVALFSTSLAAPASAAPLAGVGLGALDNGVQQAQAQWQNNHPHPGVGGPGHGGPGGPGHGGNWGHNGGGNWGHNGGGNWAHNGGGGHWHNGVWVPFAVGFGLLGAAAAAAAYGAPPQPGMCWYYDDPTQTTGHWDYC
jgi:hypothetical protein